jgi:hypothetical protein
VGHCHARVRDASERARCVVATLALDDKQAYRIAPFSLLLIAQSSTLREPAAHSCAVARPVLESSAIRAERPLLYEGQRI